MLRVLQHSALSGFHYQALDASGCFLADLVWPNFAQAKNARLRWHPPDSPDADVQIHMPHGLYRIGFEFLSRGVVNETRYTLHQGAEVLAVADVLSPRQGWQRQQVHLRLPLAAELKPVRQWGRVCYRLERPGQCLGTIEEPRWFSVKRELVVVLPPSLELPTQLFIAFMVINAAFR
ncbi:hypothetical protein [Hydrogenophaga sp. PAMC20947]|uniref:hypothetical protein n=1 Tax=Hydrogenophaga sp. PAMC20947 TaxID=2565558 RepID=UPI00109DD112|nr:hypothetical protein [Hydrogenophaga sp. PAMC20947]QCB48385.1 hypothetical protein E5678_21555 [Hydrogenophaga sp. PAMC20947]